MKSIYFRKQYLDYAKDDTWDLCNQVLYDLCAKSPKHTNKSEVLAKILLIGRSYAASVERRKNKKNNDEMFYENVVAPKMMTSDLDNFLSILSMEKKISESNIEIILQTHKYLVDLFESITKLNKRSLASKYLHFHYPHLFYIFDSRAVNSLRALVSIRPQVDPTLKCDAQYASFFYKIFELHNYIKVKYKKELSPREIDKILLWII